jgi:hypothetical protein
MFVNYLTLTSDELAALDGLPYIQRLTYLMGIKPYMDRKTFMVGIKRRISYQSLREMLYVEPGPGVQNSGSPSQDQVRRAVKQLVQAGLIEVLPAEKQLIFKCLLALGDKPVQNKPASKSPDQTASSKYADSSAISPSTELLSSEAAREKIQEPATPHKDNNYLFFLLQKFEFFWKSYPQKQGKQKAFEAFKALNPDEALASKILNALRKQVSAINEQKLQGLWVPNWKHPANWLTQQCWEDEINTQQLTEIPHAKHKTNPKRKSPGDVLWESCKAGADFDFEDEAEPDTTGNVIAFKKS